MTDPSETLDCRAAMRQLWDYLDGELPPARHDAIRTHLAVCASCYRHYAFERQFLSALKRAQAEEHVGPALHARVMEALHAEGFSPRYGES